MKKIWIVFLLLVFGCTTKVPVVTLRLATTTSTYDSGLLDHIIPIFEEKYNARVDVIAVGTGQALFIGESGDADILLVHAPNLEIEFVKHGFGTDRVPVMYNDFIIVGPKDDTAILKGQTMAEDVLSLIARSKKPFISRGDNSGTNIKELAIWEKTGTTPTPEASWYKSIGQGMGETLLFANETQAYTLTDRGTFLALSDNLTNLQIIFGGNEISENPDPELYNFYHVIPINPNLHENIESQLSQNFVEWITSLEIQEIIGQFGIEYYGHPLFFPNSTIWHTNNK